MIDNTRDLVIANTADMKNLEKKVDIMAAQLTEIHDSMLHARGAWFTLLALSSAFGFLAGQFNAIRAWLAGH